MSELIENSASTLILHVDDDESNRYAVKKLLNRAGYHVEQADCGEAGLKLARELNPDLVILDINMPDINGYEVCRTIKGDPLMASVPVLQMSANFTTAPDKVQGLESGADAYLVQPLESGVLIATVRALLRMRQAERRAQEALKVRDRIMAIVSHDLRNPLSSISLQASLMIRMANKGHFPAVQVTNLADRIQSSAQRMNNLIEDLLDLGKIESGSLRVEQARHPVTTLLRDAYELFEPIATNKKISLVIDGNGEGLQLVCDRDRVLQVLSNLIGNAVKFTPEAGTIRISVQSYEDGAVFLVQDSGPGIPEEHLKKIFDPYWQGDPEHRRGVGLGLSIAKGIVESHGGRIWVESIPGAGARFYFKLPQCVHEHGEPGLTREVRPELEQQHSESV